MRSSLSVGRSSKNDFLASYLAAITGIPDAIDEEAEEDEAVDDDADAAVDVEDAEVETEVTAAAEAAAAAGAAVLLMEEASLEVDEADEDTELPEELNWMANCCLSKRLLAASKSNSAEVEG